MALILSLIAAFVPLLQGLIGTSSTNLIQAALSAIAGLIASWTANKTADASASLAALQSVLLALKADTSISPAVLSQVAECDAIVEASIAAVVDVETNGYQLSTYVPPPAVL